MLTAGVATTASTGRIIDRFRDRVVFPITHQGQILGFVGRRNPTHTDDQHGPKYLNTPDTPLYHKGAQLFTAGDPDGEATPVLVEGPMDAIAVAIATDGESVGLAPLGTSLTDEQAAELHRLGRAPVIATDADHAGQAAAERDFWILTPYGIDPLYARLSDGSDPAKLVADGEPEKLVEAIGNAGSLADALVDEIFSGGSGADRTLNALGVIAAQASTEWTVAIERIVDRTGLPAGLLQSALVPLVNVWNNDPRSAGRQVNLRKTLDKNRDAPDFHTVSAPALGGVRGRRC